ncbi:MAG TPA: hypothetical protein H9744_16445 [Candidatus Eisenbergiella stercoravium]|nr:hypothetical protein [Candidatus Eisenbergiella stercoravium]
MEKVLKALFDYQRFQGNKRLDAMISETERRYEGQALADNDLELVNAAGEADNFRKKLSLMEDGKMSDIAEREAIYRDYHEKVLRYINGKLSCRQDAEETALSRLKSAIF